MKYAKARKQGLTFGIHLVEDLVIIHIVKVMFYFHLVVFHYSETHRHRQRKLHGKDIQMERD